MIVQVLTRGRIKKEFATLIQLHAQRMLRALGRSKAELSVVLCEDSWIHQLNRDYRGKDKPTDVLAFAIQEGPVRALDENLLGDIVISIETAKRQADKRGHALAQELSFLLAHGLLHLLGLDHPTRNEERRMSARTDLLLCAALRPKIASKRSRRSRDDRQ